MQLPADLDVIHEPHFLREDEMSDLKRYLQSDQVLWNRPEVSKRRVARAAPFRGRREGKKKDAFLTLS